MGFSCTEYHGDGYCFDEGLVRWYAKYGGDERDNNVSFNECSSVEILRGRCFIMVEIVYVPVERII
jgi:hypothetical protein